MKATAAALAVILSACGTQQWVRAPEVGKAECTASCNAHYDQCPQVFAGFPERGAVECPAERNNCLKTCENGRAPARTAAAPSAIARPPPASAAAAAPAAAAASKEARLRELKHFYDEGLVTEDVYRDRQRAILAEP